MGPRLFQGMLRKLVRQPESADDRQRVHPWFGSRTEDLGDDALAPLVFGAGKAQHLENDFIFPAGLLGPGIAHVNAVAEDRAVHAHKPLAIPLEVGADELPGGPLQHLQDFSRGGKVRPIRFAGDSSQHLIPGRGIQGMPFGNEHFLADGAVDGMGPDETASRGVPPVHPRDCSVGKSRPHGMVLADFDPFLPDQGAQALTEIPIAGCGNPQLARQRLGLEGLVSLARQRGQDLFFDIGHAIFCEMGG